MFWYWFNLILHILMLSVDVGWWVLAFRLTQKRFWRVLISVFMSVQMLALLTLHSPFRLLACHPKAFLVSIIVWHNFAIAFAVGALIIYAGARVVSWFRRKTGGTTTVPPESAVGIVPEKRAIARREFIGNCVAAAPALFTISLSSVAMRQISNFRLRRMTLSIPSLPRALDGLTIAHVTDMHVGLITCGRILKNLVTTTNELQPDLVLLTGDLINYELSDLSDAMDLVRAMPGRYGHWMIEGNHDLMDNGPEFRRRVKASDIPFLLNESATATIRGYPVQFFGLNWSKAHGSQLDDIMGLQLRQLMKQRDPDAFPIFLAHHPHAFDAAVRENLPLTLSGHTHGGQLMLNSRFGAGSILFRYWSGLYQRGNSQMVVSNGVGNMFPLRLNAPAEVIQLTLRCADARG